MTTLIFFTRADKGNVTVAMNRDDYIDKMSALLSNNNTYKTIDKDPIKKVTSDLRTLLKRWLKRDYISTERYRSLLFSDGNISRAYGLPKIHKQDFHLRIICIFY